MDENTMEENEYNIGLARTILPDGYDYHFYDVNVIRDIDEHGELNIEFESRVNVTANNLKNFFEDLYESSGSSFNVKSGRPDRKGKDSEVYGYRKCIMHVVSKDKSKELRKGCHQDCSADIHFRVDVAKPEHPRDSYERKRKKTLELNYPLYLKVNFNHNHEINRHDHKRFRDVGEETKNMFIEMFEEDMTPSAAWKRHRSKIQEKNPDDYHILMGDRRVCPDYFWVFNFYRKWIIDKLGTFDGVDAYQKRVEFINHYNEQKSEEEQTSESYAKVAQTEDGETCIAICDPFQRRVHKIIPQAGDIMIMDATLKESLLTLHSKVEQRLDKDLGGYEKAVGIFKSHVERLSKTSDSTLQKALCEFGSNLVAPISVTKRKKGSYINVQATSRSRRAFPLRGSRAAYFGAPRKSQKLKLKLQVNEAEATVVHKLPGASNKKKKKHPHDLMAAVGAGRAAEKKH